MLTLTMLILQIFFERQMKGRTSKTVYQKENKGSYHKCYVASRKKAKTNQTVGKDKITQNSFKINVLQMDQW